VATTPWNMANAQRVGPVLSGGEDTALSARSGPAVIPTLNQFLHQIFEDKAQGIWQKLSSDNIGVTDLKHLIRLTDIGVSEICERLELSFIDKVKFKWTLSELRERQKTASSVVTISPKEQSLIDSVEAAIKRSSDIQQIFNDHFNSIDDRVSSAKAAVDDEIESAIAALRKRREALHQKIDEWKASKLQSINQEIGSAQESHSALQTVRKMIDDILLTSDVRNREETIQELVARQFECAERYKVYRDEKAAELFLTERTKTIEVSFQESMTMQKLESYGVIERLIEEPKRSLLLRPDRATYFVEDQMFEWDPTRKSAKLSLSDEGTLFTQNDSGYESLCCKPCCILSAQTMSSVRWKLTLRAMKDDCELWMGVMDAKHIESFNTGTKVGSQLHQMGSKIHHKYPPKRFINGSGSRISEKKMQWKCNDRMELRFDLKRRTCDVFFNEESVGTLTTRLPDEMYLIASSYYKGSVFETTLFEVL